MSQAHVTTRDHGDISDQGSHWGPHRCPGAVQNWLSGDMVLSFTSGSIQKSKSCTLPRHTVELTLMAGM